MIPQQRPALNFAGLAAAYRAERARAAQFPPDPTADQNWGDHPARIRHIHASTRREDLVIIDTGERGEIVPEDELCPPPDPLETIERGISVVREQLAELEHEEAKTAHARALAAKDMPPPPDPKAIRARITQLERERDRVEWEERPPLDWELNCLRNQLAALESEVRP